MEHYYVINGNEFGADLTSKKNFTDVDKAKKYFEEVKYDDFYCAFVYVNSSGIEKDVETFINE